MDVFLARQPIFDKDQLVIAYELLYRHSKDNYFDNSISSNTATSILLINSYFSFGIQNIIGNKKAFINFDEKLINADIPLLLDKEKVVIELLETIKSTPSLMTKIKSLNEQGYTLAMDDYVSDYEHDELTSLCNIIKVDFLLNSKEQILSIVRTWKPRGKKLLAEKVEDIEMFEWAKKIGFDYFQGYFFSKPAVIKSKELQNNTFQYFKLMNELSVDEPDFNKITKIIEVDVTLTYTLLKLVNSSFSLVTNIASIGHALSILGTDAIKKWLSLAMIKTSSSNKPPELIKTSLIRSSFMDKIAKESSLKNYVEDINLMGILSVIDGLLEQPMNKILHSLPISQDIKGALLGEDTKYLPIYQLVQSYEQGDFDSLKDLCAEINYDFHQMPSAYFDSLKWADELYAYMMTESTK